MIYYTHKLDEEKLNKIKSLPPEDVITFDGVHKSVYENWNDILSNREVVLFVIGDWVGKFGYCNWEQIMEMVKAGATIGWHSNKHLEPKDLEASEITDDVTCPFHFNHFALPYGRFTEDYLDYAKTQYQFIYGTNVEGDKVILRKEL